MKTNVGLTLRSSTGQVASSFFDHSIRWLAVQLNVSSPLRMLSALCVGVTLGAVAWGQPLKPWSENPWYWSYHDKPILLLGGSDDDNLFQWTEEKLISQLDRIVAAGGNVIRNTMSDRKDGGFEVYPFHQLENGKYDLSQWNPEYWIRFERLLSETEKRKIIVQIEVWDRFDYTDNRSHDSKRWENHPYNPARNVNYSAAETGLENRYPEHPGRNNQPFFFSTPKQRNIQALLRYQERFVHKLLDYSLQYDHVLYCMDNETKAEPEWGEYWAGLIQNRASRVGKAVMLTEMWDDWDLTAERHRQTFDYPELYGYVDVSQNNHNSGQKHWDNFLHVRDYLSDTPRPMNTTKIYGADGNKFKHTDQDAIERFWRHLLAGAASVRFHRPDSGLGINDKAAACIKAARLLEARIPLWNLQPANPLLSDREENEAYLAATDSRNGFALYFPASNRERVVSLVLKGGRSWTVEWFDIDSGNLHSSVLVGAGRRNLSPPETGNVVAAIWLNEN